MKDAKKEASGHGAGLDLAAALDQIRDSFVAVDHQWRITYVNATAERYLRTGREDLLGKDLWEAFPEAAQGPEAQAFRSAMKTRSPVAMDLYYPPRDSWLDITAYPTKEGMVLLYHDVSAAKRAEQEVRASEQRIRLLAESARDMVYRFRIAKPRRFEYVSPGSLLVTGYAPEEYYADPNLGFKTISPEDRPMYVQTGAGWDVASQKITLRMVHKNGSIRWVENTRTPIYGTDGTLLAIEGIARDITDRREAEEALRASEERFRLLAETAQDMIFLLRVEPERHFEYCSPATLAITGYPPEEFYADPDFLLKIAHPDSKAILERWRGEAGHPESTLTVRLVHKDGHTVYMETHRVPIRDAEGRVVAVQGLGREVTERMLAEQREREQRALLDRVMAASLNGYLVVAHDLTIALANRAFLEMANATREQALGSPLAQVFPAPEFAEALQDVLKTGRPKREFEFTFERGESERLLRATITPIQSPEGATLQTAAAGQVFASFRDITVERVAQEALQHASRLVAIGEMAAGVAHEINNPLTSVLGYAELLQSQDLPPHVKRDIEVIETSARRAATVVKRLLDFARPPRSSHTPMDLNAAVAKVLEFRGYGHKTTNITVVTDLSPSLPQTLGDHDQIQQVVMNIVVNAEQAMLDAHGKGTLTVKTEAKGRFVRATFTDDGPGIPEEHMGRIFDPFFTTKEPGKGTGLGLSICHSIVAEHGGRIYAKRHQGPGAIFVVELPVATAEAAQPPGLGDSARRPEMNPA